MNIFYRGHLIHEDIPAICYTVYGRRPRRTEIAACGTSAEAMQWVDREVSDRSFRPAASFAQLGLW